MLSYILRAIRNCLQSLLPRSAVQHGREARPTPKASGETPCHTRSDAIVCVFTSVMIGHRRADRSPQSANSARASHAAFISAISAAGLASYCSLGSARRPSTNPERRTAPRWLKAVLTHDDGHFQFLEGPAGIGPLVVSEPPGCRGVCPGAGCAAARDETPLPPAAAPPPRRPLRS